MNSATKERFIKAGISSEEKMEKRVHEEIQLSVVSDNRLDMKSIRVQFELVAAHSPSIAAQAV